LKKKNTNSEISRKFINDGLKEIIKLLKDNTLGADTKSWFNDFKINTLADTKYIKCGSAYDIENSINEITNILYDNTKNHKYLKWFFLKLPAVGLAQLSLQQIKNAASQNPLIKSTRFCSIFPDTQWKIYKLFSAKYIKEQLKAENTGFFKKLWLRSRLFNSYMIRSIFAPKSVFGKSGYAIYFGIIILMAISAVGIVLFSPFLVIPPILLAVGSALLYNFVEKPETFLKFEQKRNELLDFAYKMSECKVEDLNNDAIKNYIKSVYTLMYIDMLVDTSTTSVSSNFKSRFENLYGEIHHVIYNTQHNIENTANFYVFDKFESIIKNLDQIVLSTDQKQQLKKLMDNVLNKNVSNNGSLSQRKQNQFMRQQHRPTTIKPNEGRGR
jgi:hypothetical protein